MGRPSEPLGVDTCRRRDLVVDADPGFWKTMEDLRDTRPKRLRPIVPDDPGNEEQLDSFTVKLSTGRATVALPDAVTDADLVALVRAILGRKR